MRIVLSLTDGVLPNNAFVVVDLFNGGFVFCVFISFLLGVGCELALFNARCDSLCFSDFAIAQTIGFFITKSMRNFVGIFLLDSSKYTVGTVDTSRLN